MDCMPFNLNEPALDDGSGQYVMLQKDNKTISRTQFFNIPLKVPAIWTIVEFHCRATCWDSRLPQFHLLPAFENSHQKKEWGNFMHFLWKYKKVACVKSNNCEFYICAPDGCPEYTCAIVTYRALKGSLVSVDVRPNISGIDCVPKRMVHLHESKPCVEGNIHNSTVMDHFSCKVAEEVSSASPKVAPAPENLTKNYAKTDPSYLRTLSQTHAGWIFGAVAELVDNSRDANATRLDISIECLYSKKAQTKIPVLSIVDNGHGMSHLEIMRMLCFGHKVPDTEDPDHIGRFGIGFKTGAMQLGKDALVLTQTSNSRSVAFLSQSYNENKENLEIPIITYCKQGNYMEVDSTIQSEATAHYHLKAIKDFSPFNEYVMGEKLGMFGESGTGTQIYIWNLDRWGSDYKLEWDTGENGDILIRSRRVRLRPGQIIRKIPLDYSLQAYLEVIFLHPRMKIYVQHSLVKSRPLAKSLNTTVVLKDHVMGKHLNLTLGISQVEWERMNSGIFLYWHGRLIEAYKRVGGMIHNADTGRGVLGVVDVTNLMDDVDGNVWVLNSKQGFQDCEAYAKLEEWLGQAIDEYIDKHVDRIDLSTAQRKGNARYKPDHEWVQCNKCRKWRTLTDGFRSEDLPAEWFCFMPPFNGKCEIPEQQLRPGVITVSSKRSGYDNGQILGQHSEATSGKKNGVAKQSRAPSSNIKPKCESDSGEESTQTDDERPKPPLKRLRRGPTRISCKQS